MVNTSRVLRRRRERRRRSRRSLSYCDFDSRLNVTTAAAIGSMVDRMRFRCGSEIYCRQRRLEDSPFGALRPRDLLDQSPRLKSSSIVEICRRVLELMKNSFCRNGRNSVGPVAAPESYRTCGPSPISHPSYTNKSSVEPPRKVDRAYTAKEWSGLTRGQIPHKSKTWVLLVTLLQIVSLLICPLV